MTKTKLKSFKVVSAVGQHKRTIATALALSVSISLIGSSLVYADNNVMIGQNGSGLGGIFGSVSGLVQSTVSTGNQALGAAGGVLSPVTGPVSGVMSGLGAGVGGAVNGAGVGIGATVNGITGGVNGVAGSALGSSQSILNGVNNSAAGQFLNGNVGINVNGSLNRAGPNMIPTRGIAQPGQILPIFNSATLQPVRGLNLLNGQLIGSSLQNVDSRQFTFSSANAHIKDLGSGRIQLTQGSVLLSLPSSRNSVLLESVVGKVWVGKQANVLVNMANGVLKIQNLDSAGQNVRFQMAGSQQVVSVRPGFELLASNNPLQLATVRPADGVARRSQIMLDNNRMAISEINLASLIKNQPLLSSLQSSSNAGERRVFDRLVKTAAILDMTRGRAGFVAAELASPVAEIAGTGLGTASRVVNGVVSAAGQTANSVLAAISEGQIPPIPDNPGLPGGGNGNGGGSPGGGSGITTSSATATSQSVLVANANTNTAGSVASQSAASAPVQGIVPTDQTRVNAFRSNFREVALSPEERRSKKKVTAPINQSSAGSSKTDQTRPETENEKSTTSHELYGPFPQIADSQATEQIASAKVASEKSAYALTSDQQVVQKESSGAVGRALGSAKETIRRFPEIFMALGLVIGALMLLSLALARAAFLRAKELEAMNARLAAEVSERKQLEQHATHLNEDLELRIAELAVLNQDLESARDQAVEGSRLKSEFVANISHEIRTPISAVIGMNQLLLNTNLDDKQKDYARLVNESAQSLLTVINDILDFSKIEAGKLEVNSVAFSLDTVMKEVSDILASAAQSKGLKLFTFIDPEVSNNFRGDPARLRQILINLAGNAVKFTAAGEVIIHVTRVADKDGPERVRFTVQDSGIGISPEAQSRLFQPFVQADGSTTRRYGGTGLGLSISKRLVELMGGEIHINSEEGKGSTFWFELPAWAGVAGEAARVEGTLPPNKRVLILSPQAYFPEILSKHLATVGLNAEILRSGEESAIKSTLSSSPFSAILVDSVYASALSKVIQANPEFARISIAFLRDSDSVKPPRDLHASPLTTPLNQHDLVRWMISLSRGQTDKPNNQSHKIDKDAQVGEAVFSNTRILVAEDSVVLQRMVKSLLEKLGCSVEIVANGKEAVNAANSKKYSLIFMDWQMPEMDGLEATKTIRELEVASGKHIPIIAMTANAMQGDKDTCLAAGMDGYMSKPFKLDDLRNIISQYAGPTNAT